MKNIFSASSSTVDLFSLVSAALETVTGGNCNTKRDAFAGHKLYLFYPYLNLPHVTTADLDRP